MFLLAVFAWACEAVAQEPTPVFVSGFQARNREAEPLAELLPGFLAQELASEPSLAIVPLESVGLVFDTQPATYLEACPPGQVVGCAFVVGEVAGAQYAIAGAVQSLATVKRVNVTIIDVEVAEEVVSFEVELTSGDQEKFAAKVAEVLVAVIQGEVGRKQDIREFDEDTTEVDQIRNALLGQLLDELVDEMGDVTTIGGASQRGVDPRFTMADLAEEMETDAVKPWERIGMSAQEYLRFKNSGMVLREWKVRAQGRQGQLLIHPRAGFLRGPSKGEYYTRFAQEATTNGFVLADSYTYQAITSASGGAFDVSIAYGLLPTLDVGLVLGVAPGQFVVEMSAETVGEEPGVVLPRESSQSSRYLGPRMGLSLLPTRDIRPSLEVGALHWQGTAADVHVNIPEDATSFPADSLWLVSMAPGVEIRLSPALDLTAQVPVLMTVSGGDPQVSNAGGGVFTDLRPAPTMSSVSTGLSFGLQVRLFGGKLERERPELLDVGP